MSLEKKFPESRRECLENVLNHKEVKLMNYLEEISPTVAAITSGWSHGNVGAVVLDSFVVVIDTTNSPERGRIFRDEVDSHFDVPVKYAFLTHHHSDHASGLNAFGDTTVISYKQTAKKIQSLTRINTYPSVIFDEYYKIDDNEDYVELHHSGGHTSDSSFLHFPRERVIFAGDLIFEGFMFFAGYQSNPYRWIAALERFQELRPKTIVPGHGPVLKSVKALDKHIHLLQDVVESIKLAVKQKKDPKTLDIPDFVHAASKHASKEDLSKWFRRTATSWYRRV
ncbi:MAG: MBL fold metallo-hydrolase [Candidatus Thorarchaeota archaeon]|jgi:glyoxylase-like metal-dependent hydrolase (beta-lactamase superfamily II)